MPRKPPAAPSARNNAAATNAAVSTARSVDMLKSRTRGAAEASNQKTPSKRPRRSAVRDADKEEATPRKRARNAAARKSYREDSDEDFAEEQVVEEKATPSKTPKKAAVKKSYHEASHERAISEREVVEEEGLTTPSSRKRKRATAKIKAPDQAINNTANEEAPTPDQAEDDAKDTQPKTKPRRKTKQEKEVESMPLAPRTLLSSTRLRIGAHVSAAGGVHNSIQNSVKIGANALALFLKSQRKWANPPLQLEVAKQFRLACQKDVYDAGAHVLPHGSYLVNLAVEEKERADQAYSSFLDDLLRCQELGIRYYNFHPGNTNGKSREEAIARLAKNINRAHKETAESAAKHNASLPHNGNSNGDDVKENEEKSHHRHKLVNTVLENMAASPQTSNTLGGSFQDLAQIISLIHDKSRVAVCLDTCHAFAAGYDLRTPSAYAATMKEFDKVVGGKYLKAVHVNDSKAGFGTNRDLHQNLGMGFLGLRAFHNLVNDRRYWVGGAAGKEDASPGTPLILETPQAYKADPVTRKQVEDDSVYAREIKLLESMVGMDSEGEEFKKLEAELAEKGREEREKMERKEVEKVAKEAKKKDKSGKKKGKGKGKGKDGGGSSSGEDEV